MRSVACFLAAFSSLAPAVAQWTGGPVIISGLDVEAHQVFFWGGNQGDPRVDPNNWTGVLYVRQGFDYIRSHIDFAAVNGKEIVVCLGCNGGLASELFEIAFDASFFSTQLGWQRVTITGSTGNDSIAGFFAGSHPTTNLDDVGVIYFPTIDAEIPNEGGITAAELAVLATPTNRQAIRDFVMTTKGGLFSHTHGDDEGFHWLTLSNGLMENLGVLECGVGCDSLKLALTAPEGRLALPALFRDVPIVNDNGASILGANLKEPIAGAIAWHNHFDPQTIPNDVAILAEDPSARAVVLAAPEPIAPCSGSADQVFPRFDDRFACPRGTCPRDARTRRDRPLPRDSLPPRYVSDPDQGLPLPDVPFPPLAKREIRVKNFVK
jgi:hypothetical protein